MKKMKRKALKLWKYLAENPELQKPQAYHDLGFSEDLNLCPMCEVASVNSVGWVLCDRCPMLGKWWGPNSKVTQKYCDLATFDRYRHACTKYVKTQDKEILVKISKLAWRMYDNINEMWDV